MEKNNLSFTEKLTMKAEEFVVEYNRAHFDTVLWRTPVVGIADALDTDFQELSEKVVPGHFMPSEILKSAKRVVVIFVPFTKEVVDSNTGGDFSSELWDIAYDVTNEMLGALNKYLCGYLSEQGYASTGEIPPVELGERPVISHWSHRHLGRIAGVGTFGINNMMITEKGCAGRMTSFVTEAELNVTPKMKEEQCLAKRNGTCRQCMERCPLGAITETENGFTLDKSKCVYQVYDRKKQIAPEISGGTECGKCSCGVYCSMK